MSATVIAQFVSEAGENAGPQLNLPKDVSANQLETLLNQLLTNVSETRSIKADGGSDAQQIDQSHRIGLFHLND
jgi:hypothetical protein